MTVIILFLGFIILIDTYNRYVFTEKFKGKKIGTPKREELDKRYKLLFERAGHFSMICGDGEIRLQKHFFDQNDTYLFTKHKGRKANLVEGRVDQNKGSIFIF